MSTPETTDLHDLFGPTQSEQKDIVAAASHYVNLRALCEARERALASAKQRMQQAEMDLLVTMERASVKSLRLEHVGLLSASVSKHFSVPVGSMQNENFLSWLRSAGGGDLIKQSINPQSFSAFCRELNEQETILHPDVRVLERKCVRVKKD